MSGTNDDADVASSDAEKPTQDNAHNGQNTPSTQAHQGVQDGSLEGGPSPGSEGGEHQEVWGIHAAVA